MQKTADVDSMDAKVTPMLRQYLDIKAQYPDALLFYRMGDFYEMFFEDAEVASRVLDITLTSRDKNKEDKIPMCGVPVHAAEAYLTRLVRAGHRVAVCEQVEDPREAKGLVRREVLRVVTPGLLTAEGGLGPKTNNFLVALRPGTERGAWGLACLDISTGEFKVTELAREAEALTELFRLEPEEILMADAERNSPVLARIRQALPEAFLSFRPEAWFHPARAEADLREHFRILTLEGFGLGGLRVGLGAAGALLAYALETQKGDISHVRGLKPYHLSDYLLIDEATKRNLELVANALDHGRQGTLLDVLDLTVTPMGGRLFRQWILYPLKDLQLIERRLSAVEALKAARQAREALRKALRGVYDLERLIGRVVLGNANGRDLLALRQSLGQVPLLREILADLAKSSRALSDILDALDPMEEVVDLLGRAIREDCPVSLRDGRLIREGFSAELDELIHIQRDGRSIIAEMEATERARTGIGNLKVGFNKVFGYFLEVSKAQSAKVPQDYIRKQTLVGAERYITPELKEIENKILTAHDRRLSLEYELFQHIRGQVANAGAKIQEIASAVATLDSLYALGEAADRYRYTRPCFDVESGGIAIRAGRHPVVEHNLGRDRFVPNDLEIDPQRAQMLLITGPNMAGKSTVLRQTALVALMAQMGSFVPAEEARLALVDQIFTRVGATDYLARGQSTFMVEMSETANILHNATQHSLVILDEIGRGTSTYDGLAIAWAVAEHLLNKDGRGVKTLFATHYHELTELSEQDPRVRNFHVAVKEVDGEIVFVRSLKQGAANRSYGIHVAALAGVPRRVTDRAQEILARIEKDMTGSAPTLCRPRTSKDPAGGHQRVQMALPLVVERESPLKKDLERLDIDRMTPLEALNALAKLKAMLHKE